jgi:hypothetical protein
MISAYTKLHEKGSPNSEAEKGWIWKAILKKKICCLFVLIRLVQEMKEKTRRILHFERYKAFCLVI